MGVIMLSQLPTVNEPMSRSIISYLDIISGIYVLAFELFILGVYALYLRKTRRNLSGSALDVSPFQILSGYGIASCFIILLLEALTAVAGNYTSPDITIRYVLAFGQYSCQILYTYIQLSMKYALHRDRLRNEKANEIAVEIAKEIASGTLSPDASSVQLSSRESNIILSPQNTASMTFIPRTRSKMDLRQGRPITWAAGLQLMQSRPISYASEGSNNCVATFDVQNMK
ncbi:hypothetical protein BCR33DRAFT_169225 [Rhizoclosmatium globosum]|uniref:Uncharacterized protein n=1 Tax=Rhizoclosmatium globosum TaxID=329046 RepID=A0A1Y2CEL5_9FUNG|nr:hypothetical protein BCR33DRAFT_169225 [Rhizoclosmatium globosum]|eukprot:ORY45493.1 hypothetical protein BCR33DRAFT_169225 [Rhizoclosmatium globosum]